MARFDDLAAFAAVVRAKSFTRAAAQIGVSQSALSQTVRTLERKLDLKLLNRTTRSVSPTEAGQRLYDTVAPRFSDIETELAVLGELRGKAAGTVRISATEHAVRSVIWPRLEPWLSNYPDIRIEISSDNRFIDIVADRYDIGVRLGGDVAKDMIAVRLATDMKMAVVGSPTYFAARGMPTSPQDLTEHDCIGMRLPTHGGLMTWDFQRRGRSMTVHVSGRLIFSNGDLIVSAATTGHGLGWVPEDMILDQIANGRLVRALSDWSITYPGYHLYYASRRASPALSLVIEALRATSN
ncbi:LysR family transcriptional regulator [Acidovorax sp. SUPP2522]|uniref:LysR family transcriptional regulator n=1 Tax=unclassified Acidovorax TaxID=2684926 RepID=UPI00234AE474|nr:MULTISPECIES: LysR family transcriptional regulator [unclassified Acidovorax]WCM96611.1 LysR family transcriptional regulator [Acidovorax sp. GBBC 1281]GKT20024.1 LysR family transcriptional regulator [Acidovorax sp. SUPP2522]